MGHIQDLVFKHVRSGVIVIDAATHVIIDVNPAAAAMIGLPAGDIIGKECHRFVCPAEKWYCPITDLGQTVDDSERLLVTATGEQIPILKSVIPAEVDGKKLLIENFIDIRSRKEMEERFHLFLDYTYNWEYFLDSSGKVLYSSPSSE